MKYSSCSSGNERGSNLRLGAAETEPRTRAGATMMIETVLYWIVNGPLYRCDGPAPVKCAQMTDRCTFASYADKLPRIRITLFYCLFFCKNQIDIVILEFWLLKHSREVNHSKSGVRLPRNFVKPNLLVLKNGRYTTNKKFSQPEHLTIFQ